MSRSPRRPPRRYSDAPRATSAASLRGAGSPAVATVVSCSSPATKSKREPTASTNTDGTITWHDVELVKVGTWPASTGPVTFTPADLAAAVAAQHGDDYRLPRLKLGHVDPAPGAPAIGFVTNLRLADSGRTLIGDLDGIPADLARRLPTEYPDRSIEGVFSDRGFLLVGLALLGAEQPAVGGMTSLRGLVAASITTTRRRWVSTR